MNKKLKKLIFTKHIFQLYTHSWIHRGIKSQAKTYIQIKLPQYNSSLTSGKFEVECLTGRKNGFAQIFSWPRSLNPLFFNMRSDIYHHCPIFTPRFQIFAIYLQVANLCKSIFFRPVTEIMERLTGMNHSYLKNNN